VINDIEMRYLVKILIILTLIQSDDFVSSNVLTLSHYINIYYSRYIQNYNFI